MSNINDLNLTVLLENAHIGVVIHRWDTSIVYANPIALRLLRLDYDQIIGKTALDPQWSFLDDAGKKLLIEDYPVNKVARTLQRLNNEILGVIDSSTDTICWLMINAYHEGEPDSPNSFIVVTFNDISDSKKLFSFQDIVENTQDMVIVTEAENTEYPTGPKIIYVNRAFEKLTGYKANDVIGDTPRILQGTLTDPESKRRINAALHANQAISETLLNYDIKGRPYWIEMNIIPLKNKYGEVTHFAAIERDVSERKFHLEQLEKRNSDLKILKMDLENLVEKRTAELQKAKGKLEKIAYFDPLTNIPNRRFFIDQMKGLIKSCNRRGLMMGFGLLDIDDFKKTNDNYGHDIGDLVLIELSNYISDFFRGDDAFCRYGGEEFAFAIAIKSETDAQSILTRLINGIEKLKINLASSKYLTITVSIGFKLCQGHEQVDFENEIKHADMALYRSKKEGKNTFTIIKS